MNSHSHPYENPVGIPIPTQPCNLVRIDVLTDSHFHSSFGLHPLYLHSYFVQISSDRRNYCYLQLLLINTQLVSDRPFYIFNYLSAGWLTHSSLANNVEIIDNNARSMLRNPNRTSLTLDRSALSELPEDLSCCKQLRIISAKSNKISSLPEDLYLLTHLEQVNLGSNCFSIFPQVLTLVTQLKVLHLFNNEITSLPTSISSLKSITLLNLNNNRLECLPESIGELQSLTHLSLQRNRLQSLPRSIGRLSKLKELTLGDNCLRSLPYEIGDLRSLRKLVAYRNELTHIPYTIGQCFNLSLLDLSVNQIMLVPSQLSTCKCLKELYLEQNSLLQEIPFDAIPVKEVLLLKEISLRALLNSSTSASPLVPQLLSTLDISIREALLYAEQCTVCHKYFYYTFIECVKFVNSKHISSHTTVTKLPLRNAMCSVDCFVSTGGRDVMGIINMCPK